MTLIFKNFTCILICIFIVLLKCRPARANDDTVYTPLEFKSVFTEIPNTLEKSWDTITDKDSLPWWGGVLGSTALLYYYDEDILKWSEGVGRKNGLGNHDGTKTFISINNMPILRLPTDSGSSMYFLGDGWMHVGIAFSHYIYGNVTNGTKFTNIGIQMFHSMTVSTLINQVLKRSTGRESPNVRTQYRGRWRPGPSFKDYWERTAEYDAMPSGHIMTATLTFTILINNYPEQSYWLKPTEYVWLTLLGFQMMNNGVHWASDYPIGIATGYIVGNIVSELGKTKGSDSTNLKDKNSNLLLIPTVNEKGTIIYNALWTF